MSYPLAEAAQAASALDELESVQAWRSPSTGCAEPILPREELVAAFRRRSSVRRFGTDPLPREEVAELLAWSEAPIPADAASVVRQVVTVAAVEGLRPGVYDAELNLLDANGTWTTCAPRPGSPRWSRIIPKDAAVNVWQMADLPDVIERLGERGYRWAQLEAGIRAGRLQIGAFMHGWGAAASTFYDEEVSKLLGTEEVPAADGRDRPARDPCCPRTSPPRVGRDVPPATRGRA